MVRRTLTIAKDLNKFTDSNATGEALRNLSVYVLQRGFQIDEKTNPLLAAESRVDMLRRLGQRLLELPHIFGPSGRPGQLVGMFKYHILNSRLPHLPLRT